MYMGKSYAYSCSSMFSDRRALFGDAVGELVLLVLVTLRECIFIFSTCALVSWRGYVREKVGVRV